MAAAPPPARRRPQGSGEGGEVDELPPDIVLPHVAEVADLRDCQEKWKSMLRRRVHRSLVEQSAAIATANGFAQTCMATVAGWITAQTAFHAILLLWAPVSISPSLRNFVARVVYAAAASIVVPLTSWRIERRYPCDRSDLNSLLADQACLVRTCLPMIFAWAWRDVVSAALDLVGGEFWRQLVVALVSTSVMVAVQVSPCYQRAAEAVKERGDADTALARIVAFFSNLGLAVGFAWNSVFSFAPKLAVEHVRAPLFIFMVQFVYYMAITGVIIAATALVTRSDTEKANAAEERDVELHCHSRCLVLETVASIVDDIEDTGRCVFTGTLAFVYAWAQLDAVDAFFFTYLMGCGDPGGCGYKYNFIFALFISFAFAKLSVLLKLQKRTSQWDKASKALFARALSLNAGWEWATYCKVAATATGKIQGIDLLWAYLICTVFAWLCISALHHHFAVERRCWERRVREDAEEYDFVLR